MDVAEHAEALRGLLPRVDRQAGQERARPRGAAGGRARLPDTRAGRRSAEFTEVETGRKSGQARAGEALDRCRLCKATLVIAKLDRLARNAAFLLSLRDAGIEFVACDMPDANRLTVGIMAMVAEAEAERYQHTTKAGARRRQGPRHQARRLQGLRADGRRPREGDGRPERQGRRARGARRPRRRRDQGRRAHVAARHRGRAERARHSLAAWRRVVERGGHAAARQGGAAGLIRVPPSPDRRLRRRTGAGRPPAGSGPSRRTARA